MEGASQPRGRILRRTWRGISVVRSLAGNLVFLAVVCGLLWAAAGGGRPRVPSSAALVLNPAGDIVEQLDGTTLERAINRAAGGGAEQTLLRDLLDAIKAGKTDPRIKVLLLDLDSMGGAGLTKLQDLARAIADFKKSGKKVIARADIYTQARYYLAASGDEIYLHPMGLVFLDGYSRFRTYYKDLLDRLEIDWHVFRIGEYKSAVEPYLRNGPSDEAREEDRDWLGDLWQGYLADVARARKLPAERITDMIENLPERLRDAGGDMSELAVRSGLVDRTVSHDEVRTRLIELVGENEKTHSFNAIDFDDYLKAQGGDRTGAAAKGGLVGVVVARGEILDGSQPPGKIGGDSTAVLIRTARNDEQVKALVLRVDSGGGSAFASEVIRRELELVHAAGKPVVTSMGSVAASGGYWITMASDEVWAYPTTITGSIGIYGMFPTFEKPLAKYLGLHVDGVGTTSLSGALRPDRALDPRVGEAIQLLVERGYRDFITKAAAARHTTPEAIEKIARGRVWSGLDAQHLGLVDSLGGLDQAVAAAAKRAKLGAGYKVRLIEQEPSLREQVLASLISRASALLHLDERAARLRGPELGLLRFVEQQAGQLARLNDPAGTYAICFCEVE